MIKKAKAQKSVEEVTRIAADFRTGLNDEQVTKRQADGLINSTKTKTGRSNWSIVRRNVFSVFNVLLYVIAAAMIVAQYYIGLIFLVILFANMFIGLFQDFRAQYMVRKLSLVTKNDGVVVRNGEEITIGADEIVLDDIIRVTTGNQIPADAIVVEGNIQVNESLLTGESFNVKHAVGDLLLGGSFVVSGTCYARVERVGDQSYINHIQKKAKLFKRPASRLLALINRLFQVIAVIVIIMAVLMTVMSFYQNTTFLEAVKSISGSLVSMIPSGMYLLTSMTLAVAVINLSKRRALVQEMYAIEMLARADVICIDKTGTITDGSMSLKEIINLTDENHDIPLVMGSFFRATQDQSSTIAAIRVMCPENDQLEAIAMLPFSSARKNSAVTFKNLGTYILGASSFVLSPTAYERVKDKEKAMMKRGFRVLVLAHSSASIADDKIPIGPDPVALFVIEDTIRPDVEDTIKWFQGNGVQIKVISGDHPVTVGEVCQKVGIDGADQAIDFTSLTNEEVEQYALTHSVYGRVTPEQKEHIVDSLKSSGLSVAMIGDGVNDILALKHADCSVAMASGSQATQSVSHLVLLDSNFNALPEVVKEGRRVINNLQRTWSVFLVKTFFTMLLTFVVLMAAIIAPRDAGIAYPFTTQNLYLWEFLTIGVASFFLALQPNYSKVSGNFADNVVFKALPGGLTLFTGIITYFIIMIAVNNPAFSKETAITMGVITMNIFGFIFLFRISLPLNRYRIILFTVLAIGGVIISIIEHVSNLKLFDINYSLITSENFWIPLIVTLLMIPMFLGLEFVVRKIRLRKKEGI